MKGSPLGRGLRRGGAIAAAGVLTLSAANAEAKTLLVTNTRDSGEGSFAAAVKRASRRVDLDTIRFERGLDGRIRVHDIKIPSQVRIIGTGDGRGERGVVVLQGPSLGATMTLTRGKTHKLDDLYLERLAVRGDFSEDGNSLKITDSVITGDGRVRSPGVSMSHNERYAFDGMTISKTVVEGWQLGVRADSTDARISRSIIRDNEGGGGVVSAAYSDIDVYNSTISGNVLDTTVGYADVGAGARGGYYAGLDVFNSTITGNSAIGPGASGGAVGYGVEVYESTLTGNSAPTGGAIGAASNVIGFAGAGEVDVSSSIVAGNTATDPGGFDDCFSNGGYFTSRGGNLIGDGGDCATKPTDLIGADPMLGPLRNNGGPTPTMAIPSDSPAVGLALLEDATERDQRGVKRDRHPDAGAFEYRKGAG